MAQIFSWSRRLVDYAYLLFLQRGLLLGPSLDVEIFGPTGFKSKGTPLMHSGRQWRLAAPRGEYG